MPLTPEERKKIYEEEKARVEVREQLQKEKGGGQSSSSSETTMNLTPNVAGLLCYLFGWISGVVFLVMEQKNKWIRFHAAQSIIVFGFLCIISLITYVFWWLPLLHWILISIIWICGFILWVLLMYKAYQGEYFKLPLVGDFAESMAGSKGTVSQGPPGSAPPRQTPPTYQTPPPAASAPPPPPPPPAPPSSRKKK